MTDVVGAGEGSLLVAEQLWFDEIFRDGRHVEGDEILVGARAVLVQGMGDQLLAGAALAVDEHRDAGARQAADGAEHLLHRRRLADDLRGAAGLLLACLALGALLLEVILGAPNQGHGLVDVKRLGQVFEGAALVGVDRTIEIRVGGHDDDGQVGLTAVDLLQQAQAVDPGHPDIGEDHIGRAQLQGMEQGFAIGETLAGEAFAAEGALQHPADRTVVIDDPHFGGHGGPLLAKR